MAEITVFLLVIIAAFSCVSSADNFGNFIYQVSVQKSLNNEHLCNGVIVEEKWILTSAQCVKNQSANDLQVFYGSNRLNINGSYVGVKRIDIHPAYNESTIKSDMALILTSSKITFTPNVSGSINLPKHNVPMYQQLTVSGWTANPGNENDRLQHQILETFPTRECKKQNPSLKHIIRTWLICSVEPINRENNCLGGLGSAMVETDGNILYGLRTMNVKTSVNTSLCIYNNVHSELSWIQFITHGLPW